MALRKFSQWLKGQLQRGLIAAAAGALLAPAACRGAEDQNQTKEQAAALLTSGTWQVIDAGQTLLRVFAPDGTFSSSAAPVRTRSKATGADHMSGHWLFGNDRITITYDKDSAVDQILMPIHEKTAKVIETDGQVRLLHRPKEEDALAAPISPGSLPRRFTTGYEQSIAQIMQRYSKSLVFVDGKEAAGSGFIAKIGNSDFLVTNCHVMAGIRDAGFKSLDGTEVTGGLGSAAVGEDIFCMAMPPADGAFDVMQEVEKNVAIGDPVVVLGNAEGAGVVNSLTGRIVGIGPNLVEVDAPFVPGNSGSPIIHLKSGKVIGVATYMLIEQYDVSTKRSLRKPVVRRFGYRIDSVKQWQPVNRSLFYAQAAQLDAIEKLTNEFLSFFQNFSQNQGQVWGHAFSDPNINSQIAYWVDRMHSSSTPAEQHQARVNFFSTLKEACRTDVDAAQRQMTYDYFLRKLGDQREEREQMQKDFDEILANFDR
jgi:S1-C subfamily serine protease